MSQLLSELHNTIQKNGPMPISEYMSLVLGHPDFGYYMSRDPFGSKGDFVTAPEISQVFGELIGLWVGSIWQQADSPDKVRLVELGPGRGTLISDILRTSRYISGFIDAISVHLVETSPYLRRAQEKALSQYRNSLEISWHPDFDSIPEGRLLIIANEFFDALPIEQMVYSKDCWLRRCIGLSSSQDLVLTECQDSEDIASYLPNSIRDRASCGQVFEICPTAIKLASKISKRLSQAGIGALIIDYGHNETASGDTLQALYQQKPVGILQHPGDSDLSAHVDFEALARATRSPKIRVSGPLFQRNFLQDIGIIQRTISLTKGADSRMRKQITEGSQRLLDPNGMGSLFRVMAITEMERPIPPGFSH
ncbi:MAG: SAM-dependent methyltransferase [Rhodospirillaceae bacterium]